MFFPHLASSATQDVVLLAQLIVFAAGWRSKSVSWLSIQYCGLVVNARRKCEWRFLFLQLVLEFLSLRLLYLIHFFDFFCHVFVLASLVFLKLFLLL
jgi:hypothetical protein